MDSGAPSGGKRKSRESVIGAIFKGKKKRRTDSQRIPSSVLFAFLFLPLAVAAATVTTAAVVFAGVIFAVMFMAVIALSMGIVCQTIFRKRFRRRVRAAGNAAAQPNARASQRSLCASADSAADQNVYVQRGQNAGKRAVAAPVCIYDMGSRDLSVQYVVHLELLRVTEMLEDFSVFIGDCDPHDIFSFWFFVLLAIRLLETTAACTAVPVPAAETVVSAFNPQRPPFHQRDGEFFPGGGIHLLNRRAGNVHERAAFLLRQSLPVD